MHDPILEFGQRLYECSEVESERGVLMSLAKDDSMSLRLRCPWEFSLYDKLENVDTWHQRTGGDVNTWRQETGGICFVSLTPG